MSRCRSSLFLVAALSLAAAACQDYPSVNRADYQAAEGGAGGAEPAGIAGSPGPVILSRGGAGGGANIGLGVAALARHAERWGEPSDDGVWVPGDLATIADQAAVRAHEVGEIALGLERLKLVKLRQNGILVPDLARLYEVIQFADV